MTQLASHKEWDGHLIVWRAPGCQTGNGCPCIDVDTKSILLGCGDDSKKGAAGQGSGVHMTEVDGIMSEDNDERG